MAPKPRFCNREGCEESLEGKRADAKWCSHRCLDFASRGRLPHRSWLRGIKARAKRGGIPFDLTPDDVVIPDECPILGIPLVRGAGTRNDGPSVDRFVPEKGYIKGNVHVISQRANRLKNNATFSEIKTLYHWMKKTHGAST